MERKIRVLFICVHNSGRSQMAEAFLREMAGDRFEAESAGLEPREIQPLVIESMAEAGLDIGKNRSKSVFDLFRDGKLYDYVITVCDEAVEDRCPIFPGICTRLHWPFPDPSRATGDREARLAAVREIRDAVRDRVRQWVEQN